MQPKLPQQVIDDLVAENARHPDPSQLYLLNFSGEVDETRVYLSRKEAEKDANALDDFLARHSTPGPTIITLEQHLTDLKASTEEAVRALVELIEHLSEHKDHY